LQYLNDAYRNVTISHTKYMILMIKNIFTYLQYIQKYIYTIHIYIDLFTSRVRPWTKNLRNWVVEKKG
jgi:hypothetical protein